MGSARSFDVIVHAGGYERSGQWSVVSGQLSALSFQLAALSFQHLTPEVLAKFGDQR